MHKSDSFLGILGLALFATIGCGEQPNAFSSASVSSSEASVTSPTTSAPGSSNSSSSIDPSHAVPVARASSAANLRVCAGSNVVPGADVSNYDPNTNWSTYIHAGNGFAFVKATEGLNYTSSLFSTDWAGMRKNGVLRGAYHFFRPEDDPLKQAQFYLETVGAWDIQDLPPMFDWEVSDGIAIKTQINNAKLWLQAVETATGRTPIIYLSPSFFNSLGNPQGFERYPLFIANYGVSCPSVPPPWTTWTFWQKSESGKVAGIQTNPADVDAYNGSLAQLTNFAATGN